jgi:hypothetical protein
MWKDGRTDMTNLKFSFQNFVKAPKLQIPFAFTYLILQSKTDEALLLFAGLNFAPTPSPTKILMRRETAPTKYESLHKRTTVIY